MVTTVATTVGTMTVVMTTTTAMVQSMVMPQMPALLAGRPVVARQPVSTLAFSKTQQWQSWSVRSRPRAQPHSQALP